MNLHRTIPIALLAAALALAGCDKGKKAEQPSTAATGQPTGGAPAGDPAAAKSDPLAAAAAGAAAGAAASTGGAAPASTAAPKSGAAPAQITMLSSGAEPRTALRYKFQKGSTESLVMTMDMTMNMGGMGAMTTPTIRMIMDGKITDSLPNNEARYELVLSEAEAVNKPGAMPTVVEAMQKAFNAIKGMKASATINNQGQNRDFKMDLPAGADPMMQQMLSENQLEQMAAQLPTEPVGKGAKWQVKNDIEQNGMKISQLTSFELLDFDGTKGKMKVTVEQNAPKQTISQGGVSVELTDFKSGGTGETEFDLTHLVPTMTMKLKSNYTIAAQGQTMPFSMDMTMNVAPKK